MSPDTRKPPALTDEQAAWVHAVPRFAQRVVTWQKNFGRHDLPWQGTTDPYRIWVSEVMLQQTQVETVKAYYGRFLERFPKVTDLARARPKTVLRHFAGLGYYARARNLHEAARQVMKKGGDFPTRLEALLALPGIGLSTAGAILSLSQDVPHPVLDGNVRRLLARLYLGRDPERTARETSRLWALAQALLPKQDARIYTQGVMDLGALRCRPRDPDCNHCPFAEDCPYPGIPHIRRKKTASVRSAHPIRRIKLLLIRKGGRLLLERRPPQGIWGGMSCLPEISPQDSPERWFRKLGARPGGRLVRHPALRHPLTHLELHIEVYEMEVGENAGGLPNRPTRWVGEGKLGAEPLPRPIQRFLAEWRQALEGGERVR